MVDTRFTAFNRVLEAREQSQLARELDTAESLIMQGEYDHASELLRARADDAESYVRQIVQPPLPTSGFVFRHLPIN